MESGRPCVMHIGQVTNAVAECCKSCRGCAKGKGAQSWTAANLVGVMEIDKFAGLGNWSRLTQDTIIGDGWKVSLSWQCT